MIKYLASIPVVLSILAAAYGGINYAIKLSNTVDDNADALAILKVEIDNIEKGIHGEIDNIHQTYSERTGRNASNYTAAREELVREMTEMATWVGRIEAIVNALQQGSYTVAKDAEVRAIEELVRANKDNILDMGYDMKELERLLSGGY